jgi:dolichol kinase
VETIRLRVPAFNEAFVRFWGPIIRSCEINRLSGTPYYLGAAVVAVGLFPKPIAALSLLFLACGDPMASLVGILYGNRWGQKLPPLPGGKSWIGTAAGVLTCAAVSLIFWLTMPGVSTWQLAALVVLGGLAGGLAELSPWPIDDNFTIPVLSGLILWLGCIALGVAV